MEFDKLLKLVVEKGASDLFITAGRPPTIKINGKLFAATEGRAVARAIARNRACG